MATVDFPEVAWSTDVHTHAATLQDCLSQHIHQTVPWEHRPLRTTMSDGTWNLVQRKRKVRSHLAQLTLQQRRLFLGAYFHAWRGAADETISVGAFALLHDQLHVTIASTLFEFRCLGREVTRAVRQDDVHFFTTLADEAANVYDHSSTRRFWNVIRRSLPKFKQRRMATAPLKQDCFEDAWEPYFQDLEVGQSIQPQMLVQQCHELQVQRGANVAQLKLDDLPTLRELETTFIRQTTPYRSTGFDPVPSGLLRSCAVPLAKTHYDLVLKAFLWQHEPVQFKGGPMTVIPKKLHSTAVNHFRGIMLLPSIAKRIHALLREHTMKHIMPLRPPGQLGGFAQQQVGFGSHPLRIFGRIMDACKYTSGILFVDLSNAFHRLVRELVTGIVVPQDVADVIANLQAHGAPTDGLCRWLEVPSILERIKAPLPLLRLLQDVHCNTWYHLSVSQYPTTTRRGTRPGSPLADCIFHILMIDAILELNTWIRQQEGYMAILQELQIDLDTVVWSDDLAIPWCTNEAEDFPGAMRQVLAKVHTIFARKGLQLNLDRHKTSVVASFRGKRAPALRERYLLRKDGGEDCQLPDGTTGTLHYVPVYKHLGTFFSDKHNLEQEINARIGAASAAFQQLARPVLCNRRLPLRVRTRLFQTLVLTKLFFGSGVWHTPTLQQCRRLRVALGNFAKRLWGVRDYAQCPPVDLILAKMKLLDPRVYIAQERLRFAHKVFTVGPIFQQEIIWRERHYCQDAWIDGLEADLRWMQSVGAYPEAAELESPQAIVAAWKEGSLPQSWKAMLTTTIRRHLQQEITIQETIHLHKTIFKVLQPDGDRLLPNPFGADTRATTFDCPCGRSFTSPQGLSTHRRIKHGIFSAEHHMISDATCPHCLRYFWSSQRLQQHLAYIPRRTGYNVCFQALIDKGYSTDYVAQPFDASMKGLKRVERLQAAGPQPLDLSLEDRRLLR